MEFPAARHSKLLAFTVLQPDSRDIQTSGTPAAATQPRVGADEDRVNQRQK
jgi:hypothetical protein